MTGPLPNVDNTFGAALVGLVAASFLYGVTTLQLYLYFNMYPEDDMGTKLLATGAWLLDTISLVLVGIGMYGYLVTDIMAPLALLRVNRALDMDPVLMGALALLTHGYLGARVWRVCNRNIWLAIGLASLSLSAFSLSLTAVIESFKFELWTQKAQLRWIGLAGTVLVVVLDSIIAGILSVYLLKQRVTGKGTRKLVRRVLLFAVNTGLASTVMSMINIITFFAYPNTLIFLGTNFIFTKVYANALLANLNARESLRGKGFVNEGTLSLNLSAFLTRPEDIIVYHEAESDAPRSSISLPTLHWEVARNTSTLSFKASMVSESHMSNLAMPTTADRPRPPIGKPILLPVDSEV